MGAASTVEGGQDVKTLLQNADTGSEAIKEALQKAQGINQKRSAEIEESRLANDAERDEISRRLEIFGISSNGRPVKKQGRPAGKRGPKPKGEKAPKAENSNGSSEVRLNKTHEIRDALIKAKTPLSSNELFKIIEAKHGDKITSGYVGTMLVGMKKRGEVKVTGEPRHFKYRYAAR